ncbi:metallophosphoesterase [Vibrio sp. Isolate24]|uniref:metallophosphoesterase family protein n=1 Tax=Vibrio sp. Isolate24 TaxID=2908534 RepID=UPI001EFDDA31|nr:metallophosphoesterase [Vibrio sp. Isolate24]MCG9680195.1 metallophosphoesterase [Vibrio sp. Isolate24]
MKKILLALLISHTLTGCDFDTDDDTRESEHNLTQESTLKVGILPDTQADGVTVAEHTMRAVLDKHLENGVNVVIAVGDLVDQGNQSEFESWTSIAREYQEKGLEFLPLMGNHEESYSFMVDWIDYMSEFIPKDAVHQPKKEWINYYVKRENVLMIQISYWELAFAYEWIKQVVAEHRDDVEHIFINSHDGLIGAKYGQTRELIVEGNKNDVRGELLEERWDEIREFFFQNDIIWNQGHEHLYQRSTIDAPEYLIDTKGSTPTGGNYRIPVYTQVISGNASYKGYNFRYGERDFVQNIIQMKMGTFDDTSEHFDVNAPQYTISGERITYEAFVTPHTIKNNSEGPKELQTPDWILMDKFDRTTNRCEKIVDAITIEAKMETGDARPDGHDFSFRTTPCVDSNQLHARILGGQNTLFNRVINAETAIGWDEQSRAKTPSALWARMHNYLYQDHEPWTPNFNAKERAVEGIIDNTEFKIPPTSMDMKKHITLSWDDTTTKNMLSDVLIISGMTTHTGTYQDANGGRLDIEVEEGVKTTHDDWDKPAEPMPSNATKDWDINQQKAVAYSVEFDLPQSQTVDKVALATYKDNQWVPMVSKDCVLTLPYEDTYLDTPPNTGTNCDSELIVGYDVDKHAFWTILHDDAELALIKQ